VRGLKQKAIFKSTELGGWSKVATSVAHLLHQGGDDDDRQPSELVLFEKLVEVDGEHFEDEAKVLLVLKVVKQAHHVPLVVGVCCAPRKSKSRVLSGRKSEGTKKRTKITQHDKKARGFRTVLVVEKPRDSDLGPSLARVRGLVLHHLDGHGRVPGKLAPIEGDALALEHLPECSLAQQIVDDVLYWGGAVGLLRDDLIEHPYNEVGFTVVVSVVEHPLSRLREKTSGNGMAEAVAQSSKPKAQFR
jgi:hypothetical protein